MYKVEMFKIKKLKFAALSTSLFVSLLMLSMSAQAESNTASENSSGKKLSEQATSGQIYSDQKQKSIAVTDNDAHQGATHLDIKPQGDLPHWPENRPMKQKLIPPPPPGPYMSTAMSNHVVRGPAYRPNRGQMRGGQPRGQADSQARSQTSGHTRNNSARHNPSRSSTQLAMPMVMYSPDRPWPDDLRPQPRRMPESGYRHATPVPHNAPPQINNGYRTGAGNSHPANRYRSQPGSYHPGGYPPQGAGINQLKKHAQHPHCDRYKKHHPEQDRQAKNMPTHNRPNQSRPAQSMSTQGRP